MATGLEAVGAEFNEPSRAELHVSGSTMRFWFGLLLSICVLSPYIAQAQPQDPAASSSSSASSGGAVEYVFNYLNMAGVMSADQFAPLTQRERTQIYWKAMINPLGFIKASTSAGIDQWNDKPKEWHQDFAGYGRRFANILGQYSIQRTVTFICSSGLHEDNRYFNSGKSGLWSRTRYALASGVLARHDDGSRHPSVSQVAGVAAGAFLSRTWQPPSQHTAGDAAVSFGITMSSNIAFSVLKEFLPDIGRAIRKKRGPPAPLPKGQSQRQP